MKNPTPIIVTLVVLYLIGLGYLAFRESRLQPPVIQEQGVMAPDGSMLKGPTSQPQLAPTLDPTRPPQGQSVGPSYPPPAPKSR